MNRKQLARLGDDRQEQVLASSSELLYSNFISLEPCRKPVINKPKTEEDHRKALKAFVVNNADIERLEDFFYVLPDLLS